MSSPKHVVLTYDVIKILLNAMVHHECTNGGLKDVPWDAFVSIYIRLVYRQTTRPFPSGRFFVLRHGLSVAYLGRCCGRNKTDEV